MKEYRIKVTIRNNLLLSAIEDAGYKSQADFGKSCGLTPQEVNSLVAMRTPPINSDGQFTPTAQTVMEILGACPTDLWTEEQLTMQLRRNTVEKELSKEAIMDALQYEGGSLLELASPEDVLDQKQQRQEVADILETLTPTERKVLSLKYGIGEVDQVEHSDAEIAKVFNKSRIWPNIVEAKAMRKLHHPSRANRLKRLTEEN